MGAAEICHEGEIDFAKPLARALLRDARLSFGARGLFAFLWDLPRGWRVNSAHLVSQSPAGKDAIRTLLKELRQVGSMRIEDIRDPHTGRVSGSRWILVNPDRWAIQSPLSAGINNLTESRKNRPPAFPRVGETATKVLQQKDSSIGEEAEDLEDVSKSAALRNFLVLENEQDEILLVSLLAKNSAKTICDYAEKLIAEGKRPYLSAIKKLLSAAEKTKLKEIQAVVQQETPIDKVVALEKLRKCKQNALMPAGMPR